MKTRGPRGRLGGGGNKYAIPFVDMETKRIFMAFTALWSYVSAQALLPALQLAAPCFAGSSASGLSVGRQERMALWVLDLG